MNNDFLEKDSNRGGLFSTMVKKIGTIEEWIRKHNSVRHQGVADSGWIPVNETWTYNAANIFNIPTDGTLKYQKGMPIRWKNAGDANYRYGNLQSVAATTLTTFTNTDYVIANSTISDVSYSPVQSPFGFPEKFNYSSVISGSGGTAGAYAETVFCGYYIVVGKSVRMVVVKRITNKGSWSGSVFLATPVNSSIDGVFNMNLAVVPTASITSRAIGNIRSSGVVSFENSIATTALTWASIAVNDFVICDATYLY